jgi:hypothetical protein
MLNGVGLGPDNAIPRYHPHSAFPGGIASHSWNHRKRPRDQVQTGTEKGSKIAQATAARPSTKILIKSALFPNRPQVGPISWPSPLNQAVRFQILARRLLRGLACGDGPRRMRLRDEGRHATGCSLRRHTRTQAIYNSLRPTETDVKSDDILPEMRRSLPDVRKCQRSCALLPGSTY